MPVLIDVSKEVPIANPRLRDLTKGAALELTQAQRDMVVLTKYVSSDPLRADWQPAGEWFEQVTADVGGQGRSARIQVAGLDGEARGAIIDDGLIIDLVGTLSRLVGILPGRAPMSESEVEEYFDATQMKVPLFQQWDFRVARVLKTDGPEQRVNLVRSEEQKRLNAQTDMFEAITRAFKEGLASLVSSGNLSPAAQDILRVGVKKVQE